MIRILVVDDHDLVRAGITRMLGDEGGMEVIGEASSGEDAIFIAQKDTPDVILMDLRMPGIGGMEAIRKITRLNDECKIIAVTACADDPYPSRVMQAGAAAYITKDADIKEIIRAIRLVHSGQRYMSPEIAQKLALKQFNPSESEKMFDVLSEREMQITMMVVNCQKVQDISDLLCLSPKTVNAYRYRIFEKLDVSGDVELTHLAIRHGLLDTENID